MFCDLVSCLGCPSQVNFSSLDIHLHTEALLNAMNFVNSLLPPEKKEMQEELPTIPEEEDEEEGKKETAVARKHCMTLNSVTSFM